LNRKVIFITGVSSGFGRETALFLAGLGHQVYGSVRRNIDDMPTINLINMDVTDSQSVQRAVDEIITKEGHIDVLINNAGMGIAGALEETNQEELFIQMDTNFFGTVRTINAILPYFRKQQYGTIINISSIGGLMGLPFQGYYSASKFAIEGYSQALRLELKPFNINVVVVNPGDFATQFTANRKVIAASGENSVYPQFETTLRAIEKDESNGLSPRVLAQKIARIVVLKKPAHRYIVASPVQKISVTIMKLLPAKWFTKLLADYYGIK